VTRTFRTATAVALLALSTGCFTTRYETRLPSTGPRKEYTVNYFFWGLVGNHNIDLDAACPAGASRWYNEATFLDGFLATITLGIYVPRTVVIHCTQK
jgi:hypothetical protein